MAKVRSRCVFRKGQQVTGREMLVSGHALLQERTEGIPVTGKDCPVGSLERIAR